MKMSVENKVVIVTGASQGLGRAIAVKYAKNGANVILAARDRKKLEKLEKEINEFYGRAFSIQTDITKEKDVKELINKVYRKFGKIDILINNAGVWIDGPIYEMKTEDWNKVIDVNMKGVFLCSREASKYMIKQESGHIINIASVASKIASKNSTVYCASKFGVFGFSKSLAKDLKDYGIKVTTICPSAIDTDLFKGKPHVSKKMMMRPEKVANVVYDVGAGKNKKSVVYVIKPVRFFLFVLRKLLGRQ